MILFTISYLFRLQKTAPFSKGLKDWITLGLSVLIQEGDNLALQILSRLCHSSQLKIFQKKRQRANVDEVPNTSLLNIRQSIHTKLSSKETHSSTTLVQSSRIDYQQDSDSINPFNFHGVEWPISRWSSFSQFIHIQIPNSSEIEPPFLIKTVANRPSANLWVRYLLLASK